MNDETIFEPELEPAPVEAPVPELEPTDARAVLCQRIEAHLARPAGALGRVSKHRRYSGSADELLSEALELLR